MSTTRLATTKMAAVSSTTPWMMGRSLVSMALQHERAQARDREDLLDDDRSSEQVGELDAEDRHGRREGVLQGQPADDLALG